MSEDGPFADLAAYWPGYLGIVLVGGVLGFAACRMARIAMFRPAHPIGPLHWQGTVGRSSERLAGRFAELVATHLLSEQELLSRIDPEALTEAVRGPLAHAAEDVTVELLREHKPGLWELLPERGKRRLIDDVSDAAPRLARRITEQVEVDASDVFDLRSLVHRSMTAEPTRLVRLVQLMSAKACVSVERYGTAFGLAVGIVAALLVGLTGHPLLLPIFGAVAGLLAYQTGLRLLFGTSSDSPQAATRQAPQAMNAMRGQVATDTATVFATEIVTFDAVVTELLRGPRSERLHTMIRRDIQHAADAHLAIAKPLVTVALGSTTLREIRYAAAERSLERLPTTMQGAANYMTNAMDVRRTVAHRVRGMPRQSFRALLLPALTAQMWRLVAPGALLGLVVGVAGWAALA